MTSEQAEQMIALQRAEIARLRGLLRAREGKRASQLDRLRAKHRRELDDLEAKHQRENARHERELERLRARPDAGDLRGRLGRAHREVFRQRKRAELWRARALR